MSVIKAATSIGKFISKYGDEAALTAKALVNILDGLALKPSEAAHVREAIERLENAAVAISNSKVDYHVKIEKRDIIDAVNDWLNKNAASILKGNSDTGAGT